MAKPQVLGGDLVAKNIIAFQNRFLDEVNSDMEAVATLIHDAVYENISLTDHSLQDLADLGHPYSRRGGGGLHSPDFQVHTQSGKLLSGLFKAVEHAEVVGGRLVASASIGIRDNVEYAIHVIVGTSRMVPRDFLVGTLGQKSKESLDILKRSLKSTVINFAGKNVKL